MNKEENLYRTGLVCPKCGNTQIHVELRSAGTTSKTNYYRTGVKGSWLIPSGQRARTSQRNYKSIALCQNCGNHWEVCSGDHANKRVNPALIALLIICLSLVCFAIKNSNNETHESSIWAIDCTPLTDFEYYIDDGSIYLTKYEGRSRNVYIASFYNVDGRELPVVSLDGVFTLNRVDSVIIPEGVIHIANNAFNSCGIKYLYLPSTLEDFEGWNYFHDVEKIYYGGDETAWSELFLLDRSRLDVVEVICNTSISDFFPES